MRIFLIICLLCAWHFPQAQVASLSDEFDNSSSAENWLRVNDTEGWDADQLEGYDINETAPGKMYMLPYTCGWFADRRAPLVYKLIDSRYFSFTTKVTVTNREGNGIPSSIYSLAGPMIRTPKNFPTGASTDWVVDQENYVFLACGNADVNTPNNSNSDPAPHFEVKTTINSNSDLEISGIATLEEVVIRLVRLDNVILAIYKTPGSAFQVHKRYNRSDFPDEVQVGLVTYTDWNTVSSEPTETYNSIVMTGSNYPNANPDLIAQFEYARFHDVEIPSSLAGVDFFAEATDEQILSFLGESLDPEEGVLLGMDSRSPEIDLYPNPAKNELTIRSGEPVQHVYLIDLTGKQVMSRKMTDPKAVLNLKEYSISEGIYTLVIQLNNRAVHKKLIIRK